MPEAGTQLTRQSQELTIFHDVAKALTSSLDLDSILQTIMDKMAEYFRPDTWSLLMVDEKQDDLYFAIAVGDKREALKNVRLQLGEGIAGWVAKHGDARVVPDVRNDPFFSSRVDDTTKWETRSMICVPLRSKLRVLGVIQLVNVDMERFKEPELFFLQALCDYAAIAIENARWVEKIQELTITDDCTGLYNARHLYKTLETEVYRSSRFGYEFSILFIDLDHFKSVNDTHGHLIGSKLLAEIRSDYAAIAIENARWVEKIQELTITDDCTGLYNARHLYKTLETEVYRSSRFGYEFSILFIDLDHFKSVNDTHGHLIGSKLLAEI